MQPTPTESLEELVKLLKAVVLVRTPQGQDRGLTYHDFALAEQHAANIFQALRERTKPDGTTSTAKESKSVDRF